MERIANDIGGLARDLESSLIKQLRRYDSRSLLRWALTSLDGTSRKRYQGYKGLSRDLSEVTASSLPHLATRWLVELLVAYPSSGARDLTDSSVLKIVRLLFNAFDAGIYDALERCGLESVELDYRKALSEGVRPAIREIKPLRWDRIAYEKAAISRRDDSFAREVQTKHLLKALRGRPDLGYYSGLSVALLDAYDFSLESLVQALVALGQTDGLNEMRLSEVIRFVENNARSTKRECDPRHAGAVCRFLVLDRGRFKDTAPEVYKASRDARLLVRPLVVETYSDLAVDQDPVVLFASGFMTDCLAWLFRQVTSGFWTLPEWATPPVVNASLKLLHQKMLTELDVRIKTRLASEGIFAVTNIQCKSLAANTGARTPGEIDVLAFDAARHRIYVLESKDHRGTFDPRTVQNLLDRAVGPHEKETDVERLQAKGTFVRAHSDSIAKRLLGGRHGYSSDWGVSVAFISEGVDPIEFSTSLNIPQFLQAGTVSALDLSSLPLL